MIYEPGSAKCRVLIAVKHNLEDSIKALNSFDDMSHIERQLRDIHKDLECMHELQRFNQNSI